MRLAHFETSMNWGGQELRIIEQIEWLLEHNHPCWLIARPGSAILEEAERRNLPGLSLPVRGSLHPKTLKKLLHFLRENKVDILDCHGSRDAAYGLFVKYLTNTKVIRSRHVTTSIRRGFLRDLVWRKGNHGIITTAKAINDKIVDLGLSSAEKIYTALPGVDEQRFIPGHNPTLRERYNIPEDAIVIANVGMIRPDKGQEFFVQACSKLMECSDKVYAIQVGEATASTQQYKQKVMDTLNNSAFSGRIKFLGYHHDIENFIAMADIVAVCSTRVEAQTRLVSQAFLMQKNVVASNIGGLPEMIINNQTGLLVPSESAEAIFKALKQLIDDPKKTERFKQQAYEYGLEHFTFDKMMLGMLDKYAEFSK